MIENIVHSLVLEIEKINFADNVGGLVKILRERIKDTVKQYPIYPNHKSDCSKAEYKKFVPDSKFMSCIYFEEINTQIVSDNRDFYTKQSTVRLVCWFNLPKINKDLTNSEQLELIVMDAIPEVLTNVPPASNISIKIAAQQPKSAGIFGKYNYDETVRPYLIYPFDYFSIDYVIKYNVGKNCVEPITLDPDPC